MTRLKLVSPASFYPWGVPVDRPDSQIQSGSVIRYYRSIFRVGPVVQRSERAAHNRVVAGSNPAGPTNLTVPCTPDVVQTIRKNTANLSATVPQQDGLWLGLFPDGGAGIGSASSQHSALMTLGPAPQWPVMADGLRRCPPGTALSGRVDEQSARPQAHG